MMYQAGLVLEGGAMKGVYTAGVLDFFLDAGIDFAKCYGVSAGACCLCSYLSRQKGRQYSVFTDYLEDKNYWGLSSLLRTGDYFNVQMCYHDIPERLNPFDYETFDKNPSKGYAVVTNIETGLAEYLPMKNMRRDIEAVRASASMPLVSRPVEINGKMYLDGGLADSIPLLRDGRMPQKCRCDDKRDGLSSCSAKASGTDQSQICEISEGIRADGKPRSSL